MRRIVVAVMGTVSGLVLLFSYHTSTNATSSLALGAGGSGSTPGTTPGTTPSPSSGTSTSGGSSAAAPSTGSSSSSSSAAAASGTFTGDSVDTRWGPVQVAITVSGGKITKSEAVVYPQGNGRDQEINAYALPVLSQEAVQAQSAQIDAVSGATVTSDGYLTSLQSAIDKAHL